MLKEICTKEEVEIFRSEETEREIVSALRKNGIKVKKIELIYSTKTNGFKENMNNNPFDVKDKFAKLEALFK